MPIVTDTPRTGEDANVTQRSTAPRAPARDKALTEPTLRSMLKKAKAAGGMIPASDPGGGAWERAAALSRTSKRRWLSVFPLCERGIQ